MSEYLLQKALNEDWHKLPRLIQQHYEVSAEKGSCLEGFMTITYPDFMLPMIWLIHQLGGLVFRRDPQVHTQVRKSVDATGQFLNWHRTLTYQDGNVDYFRSQMAYSADHQLIEAIDYGFGLRLTVAVENGDLVYRSNGHFWRCKYFQIILPDGLLLGSATISEHVVSEHEFYLDFTIKHPLWGETYAYRGRFKDCV